MAKPSPRRFPPPWSIDEYNDACFIVKDADGHALGYVYFEEEPGRQTAAAHQGRGAAAGGELRKVAGVAERHSAAAAFGTRLIILTAADLFEYSIRASLGHPLCRCFCRRCSR
jgi:hypothetical protein